MNWKDYKINLTATLNIKTKTFVEIKLRPNTSVMLLHASTESPKDLSSRKLIGGYMIYPFDTYRTGIKVENVKHEGDVAMDKVLQIAKVMEWIGNELISLKRQFITLLWPRNSVGR